MPELRGKQATEDVKEEWKRAYEHYQSAPGVPHNKKLDCTEVNCNDVAEKIRHLTRKQAKRRVKNFEWWQRNIKKGLDYAVVPAGNCRFEGNAAILLLPGSHGQTVTPIAHGGWKRAWVMWVLCAGVEVLKRRGQRIVAQYKASSSLSPQHSVLFV